MAKGPKVVFVKFQSTADYKVYFCKNDFQQKNEQLIAGAELVKSESQAEVKLFEVKSESQADIKITHKKFSKAG